MKNKKVLFQRILAFLLVTIMVLSLGMPVFAAEDSIESDISEESVQLDSSDNEMSVSIEESEEKSNQDVTPSEEQNQKPEQKEKSESVVSESNEQKESNENYSTHEEQSKIEQPETLKSETQSESETTETTETTETSEDTQPELIKNENNSKVLSETELITKSGYTVKVNGNIGLSSVSVSEIKDDMIKLSASEYWDYFKWDGWYINDEKISENKTCEYTITSNSEIEARVTRQNVQLRIYVYADPTDSDILDLSHSPKHWISQGIYSISDELLNSIASTGITRKENNKTTSATNMVYSTDELQQLFSKSGLDYTNYKFRFVREDDGIHLDAVISSAKFPSTGSGEEVNEITVIPKLLIFVYAQETDDFIMKLSHSPNKWFYFGTSNIGSELYKEIINTGIGTDEATKTVYATDFIKGNESIKQLLNVEGIDYTKYDWRLVNENDGIHLDAVLLPYPFPGTPSKKDDAIDVKNPPKDDNKDKGQIKFAIDGIYTEWVDYPHIVLTYSGGDDAYSAIYNAGSETLFDVWTEMPAHLSEAGGEFTSGITVLINDDYSLAFYPRFITVDDSGNINWDPQKTGLSKGVHHFYLASTDAWHTSTNTNNLHETDKIYGDAYIEISDTRDEIEWKLDMNMVAEKLGIDPSEIKTISVFYSRLGPQQTTSAGTPTGLLGIFICLGLVAAGFIGFRIKSKK